LTDGNLRGSRRLQDDVRQAVRRPGDRRVQGRPMGRSEATEAGAYAWPACTQPLRGRHGEMHRLRAVRRRVPGQVHLRARRRQRSLPPDVAGRAFRVRLRDQLPPLHPLRPVRRGLPDRGDHRDEAVRVVLHQPSGRDLHEVRTHRRRRRQRQADAMGGLARRGGCPDQRLDAGHLILGRRDLRRHGRLERRARVRRAPGGARSARAHRSERTDDGVRVVER